MVGLVALKAVLTPEIEGFRERTYYEPADEIDPAAPDLAASGSEAEAK